MASRRFPAHGNGLPQEFNAPPFIARHRHGDVTVPRWIDYWEFSVRRGQIMLKIKATLSGNLTRAPGRWVDHPADRTRGSPKLNGKLLSIHPSDPSRRA